MRLTRILRYATVALCFAALTAASSGGNKIYLHSQNHMTPDWPELSGVEQPEYSCEGCEVNASSRDPKRITVVPYEKQFTLKAKNESGKTFVEKKMRAQAPPKPDIQLLLGADRYEPGEKVSRYSDLIIKVRADEDFGDMYPNDARYRIRAFSLYQKQADGEYKHLGEHIATSTPGAYTMVKVALADIREVEASRDLKLVVKAVERINFEDESFDSGLTAEDATFVISMK